MQANQPMLKAQREVGDKIFTLLWGFTFIQAGLILWESINMIPALSGLLGSLANPSIQATELSTTGYLALQLAYMGKKEYLRWTKGLAPASLNFKGSSTLDYRELTRRIQRGDVALLLWGALFMLMVLAQAFKVITTLPAELTRTFFQVMILYTVAAASKTRKESLSTKPNLPPPPSMPSRTSSANQVSRQVGSPVGDQIVEYLSKNGDSGLAALAQALGGSKSTVKSNLRKLVIAGAITSAGAGKATTYRKK